METQTRPAPLLGCLICHTEGQLSLAAPRRMLGLGSDHPVLSCQACGSTALLDWEEGSAVEDWRIRYRRLAYPDAFAASIFGSAGWLEANDALELSTQVFVHRQRLEQARQGNLSWLQPHRLNPPPPLMNPEEVVYVQLRAVNYAKAAGGGFLGLNRENDVLDSGAFYITSSKIHMLGQRRDRSHRLTDILKMEHKNRDWLIYVGDEQHYYENIHQEPLLDGELLIAIITALRARIEE